MADLTFLQAALPVLVTDENNSVLVTAGSTAAVASSAALTVALSPNSPPALNTSGTATLSTVAGSASSVTILAANTSRKMAAVFNDSTHAAAVLYLSFGSTASTTNYTVQIASGSYYEFPTPIYTGVVDGLWSSNTTANARVTEFT